MEDEHEFKKQSEVRQLCMLITYEWNIAIKWTCMFQRHFMKRLKYNFPCLFMKSKNLHNKVIDY